MKPTVTIEHLPVNHPTTHRWRTIFHNLEGQETSISDSQSVAGAIGAIADRFGYDLQERTWKCPDCSKTYQWSYDHLADHGEPICDGCDVTMELRPEE